MTKKLRAIILSLMLAFSLSLITGCQKAKEQAGEVKEEATETKAEIKENAAETAREIKDEAVEPLKQDKEKAAKTTGEIKDEAAEPLKQDKEKAAETAEEIKEEAVEAVREITITGDKEKAAKTTREIKDEAMETVIEITIIGDKENAAETAEDTEEEGMEEIEPSEEAKIFPAPTLIAEPDYRVIGSTVRVTLEWYPVTNQNPVKYFVRLSSGDGFFYGSFLNYGSGWISGTNWTREIPSPCHYIWSVKARDDVSLQESAWAARDIFLVNSNCPPIGK